MTRRGRSSCSKKTEPGRGTNVKHDALVCNPVDRKIEQEMRSRPFTELVLKGAPPRKTTGLSFCVKCGFVARLTRCAGLPALFHTCQIPAVPGQIGRAHL